MAFWRSQARGGGRFGDRGEPWRFGGRWLPGDGIEGKPLELVSRRGLFKRGNVVFVVGDGAGGGGGYDFVAERLGGGGGW